MEIKTSSVDVGVIIGRFQIDQLHEAHIDLISTVVKRHIKVIMLLGVKGITPVPTTKSNPLDFETRRLMIHALFPNLIISYIKDVGDDSIWSKNVDEKILDLLGPNQSVLLYGEKDSFLTNYIGRFQKQELVPSTFISESYINKELILKVVNDTNFRRGVIWAVNNQFPTCYPTVDVAIYNKNSTKLLLCRKENETKFRFVGGFADPKSQSYEMDAKREIHEELGIEINDIKYIGSTVINDWRYKDEIDKIKTILYSAKYIFGSPRPNDDIVEAKWIDIEDIKDKIENIIVSCHVELAKMFLKDK
ncbi:MAG: NUDIX domain-containing protein [Patescibacteria group bacterium]|jgi:bifunctional NMN adenylyltransferase/nudix hydrolase